LLVRRLCCTLTEVAWCVAGVFVQRRRDPLWVQVREEAVRNP
jgi:hypothetical protein